MTNSTRPVRKLVHIINIVNFKPNSEHEIAQNITLETLRRAKEYAEQKGMTIRLLSTQYNQDRCRVPEWFEATDDLQFSSLDFPNFADKRQLPSIKDIINRAIDNADDADAIIYSNIDIAVQKEIYIHIKSELEEGNNSISVTRRTIPKELNSVEDIERMYECEGKDHPGDDFFVLSKNCFDKLNLKPVFVGAAWFDKVLLLNCAANCQPFKKIRDKQWTFHIGEDFSWKNSNTKTISVYNRDHIIDLIKEIESEQGNSYRNKIFWPYVGSIYEKLGFEVPLSLKQRIIQKLRKIKSYFSQKI